MCDLQAAGGTTLRQRSFGPVQFLALGVGILGFGIDQLTKLTALTHLEPGRSIDVIGELLKLTLIFNPGAAFGMGSGFTVGFSIFAILALLACLFYALPRMGRATHAMALGLLMAGISGNLWDRIFQAPGALHGHVIDFIHVPFFAIFNVADICITLAAVWIVILSFTSDTKTDAASVDEESESDVASPEPGDEAESRKPESTEEDAPA